VTFVTFIVEVSWFESCPGYRLIWLEVFMSGFTRTPE